MTRPAFAAIREAIETAGLVPRGAFHPSSDDLPAGVEAGTVVLAGFAGLVGWPAFARSPEAADGSPHPLDRWSRRVIGALARTLGADAKFPFDGPPWMPFLRWGRKAEALHPSPLGMLIHPDWGLWHSWRGALLFAARIALPAADLRPSPCESCAKKPCLQACPVGAFTPIGYDVAACAGHIDSAAGADCMAEACRARRACPAGASRHYVPDEAEFHMKAFRAAQRPLPVSARPR